MSTPVSKLILLAIFFGFYDFNYGVRMLKVIPGTPRVVYIDEYYVQDYKFQTRRYGRKGDYVVNIEFNNKYTLGSNNVSLHIVFYEYLHNEYRRSFVEMHFKLCDLILKDPYIGLIVRTGGITVCPLPPGKKSLSNLTFNYEFPNIVPFEKGKGELVVKFEPSGKMIAKGDLVLTFKMRDT